MLTPLETVKLFQCQPGPQVFAPGDIIFKEGESGEVIYGVLEGEINLRVDGQVVETIQVGDIFGEGALVDPEGLRASTAIAKTAVKLAVLDRERFLFVVQETPRFALNVMRSLSLRLRQFKQHVEGS